MVRKVIGKNIAELKKEDRFLLCLIRADFILTDELCFGSIQNSTVKCHVANRSI